MLTEADRYLLRSAQWHLLGQVTPNLRSVSFEIDGELIFARAVYDHEPSEDELELVSDVFGYIIGDYVTEKINEEQFASKDPLSVLNLRLVAYQRHEGPPV